METPTEYAIPMHEFTVLTGEALKLTNQSDRVIVRTSEIQQIIQILPKKLNDEQIDRIADIFELEQQAYFEWMQEQEEAEARWRRFTGLD